MSRSPKNPTLRRAIQFVLAGAAICGAVYYANWIVRIDPLARYRPDQGNVDSTPGLEMGNVDLVMFDGDDQVGTLRAKRMTVSRDRTQYILHDIEDGRVKTAKGEFKVSMKQAEYNQRRQTLAALKGARFWNDKMDIKTDGFTYSRRGQTLQTVGRIEGSIGGGKITASSFHYFADDESFRAADVHWVGIPDANLQELPGARQRVAWDIRGDLAVKGDLWIYKGGRATDGEIIMLGDTIEHNRKTDVVTATGNVRYFSSRANLTCEKVVVYRKEKRAVLTGNVTMLVKPKEQEKLKEAPIPPFRPIVPEGIAKARPAAPTPEDKQADDELRSNTARKYPTQVWAEKIVYWYAKGSRRAEISGKPQARQELPNGRWRHLWTVTAFYDDQAQTLKLVSSKDKKDTRVITSIGDDLVAEWLLVSTDDSKEDEMSGKGVEGTVMSDDEDTNDRSRGTNPPPPGGGTPPPALRGRIGG